MAELLARATVLSPLKALFHAGERLELPLGSDMCDSRHPLKCRYERPLLKAVNAARPASRRVFPRHHVSQSASSRPERERRAAALWRQVTTGDRSSNDYMRSIVLIERHAVEVISRDDARAFCTAGNASNRKTVKIRMLVRKFAGRTHADAKTRCRIGR